MDDVGSCLAFLQGREAQNQEPPAWPPETGRKAWENSRAQGPGSHSLVPLIVLPHNPLPVRLAVVISTMSFP